MYAQILVANSLVGSRPSKYGFSSLAQGTQVKFWHNLYASVPNVCANFGVKPYTQVRDTIGTKLKSNN